MRWIIQLLVSHMTNIDYVRCEDLGRRWYRSILDQTHHIVRLSRKQFKRSSEAKKYKARFVGRLQRGQDFIRSRG